MKEEQQMEETLWNYIDGRLKGEELSFVEALLKKDNEWKAKHAELTEIHQLMQNHLELDQPSLRFTQNVMENISREYISPATGEYINKNIIRGIGLFFLISILGLVIYAIGRVQWTAAEPGMMSSVDFSKIDYSRYFNNTYVTAFMMINLILLLMIADMYLTKKKTIQLRSKMNHRL